MNGTRIRESIHWVLTLLLLVGLLYFEHDDWGRKKHTLARLGSTTIPVALTGSPSSMIPFVRCQLTGRGCRKDLLEQINTDRAQVDSSPLVLDRTLTYGSGFCIGAQGHARHMAESGQISHDQFPQDVCSSLSGGPVSENVGEASVGANRWSALLMIHTGMMSEPYSDGCLYDHHCSLVYPGFHRIGIGIKVQGGIVWLSEELSG